jgi:transcriptional regulator GlxA family with amidase domain
VTRHRLVVVAIDGVLPLDLAIPMHVFAREASEVYDVVAVTLDGRPVPVAGGTSLVPDGGLGLLRGAQTVLVPGYADAAETPAPVTVVRALAAASRRGSRMVSICSGAFALAQAGLLDGHRATTHWFLCADLASQHPEIAVDDSVMFVDDGDVLTSGGVTAGVDLCLHLLARDLGPAAARHVARRIVMTPRRDGDQRQFTERKMPAAGDDTIAAVQQWLLASLDANVTVVDMAARARMSPRSFYRRFGERTGTTPLAWLLDQRIARAKELLVSTDVPVETIAAQVGLGTPANFRTHFRRATSQSPSEHRRQFSFG